MHRMKKMFAIENFYFRGGKAILQKFTPHPGGRREWEIILKFQIGVKFFLNKTHVFLIENPKLQLKMEAI